MASFNSIMGQMAEISQQKNRLKYAKNWQLAKINLSRHYKMLKFTEHMGKKLKLHTFPSGEFSSAHFTAVLRSESKQ